MKDKLVDHQWTKITGRDSSAKDALRDKIKQITQLEEVIRSEDGEEAAHIVFDDGRIKHALTRCLENLEGSNSVNEHDFWICYEYATAAAKKAQVIIDEQ